MIVAIFKTHDGAVREVVANEGESLMQVALRNGIEGIVAECGGECACATCHVYVAATFAGMLPPPDAVEQDMLDFVAAERKTNSRLSCQIKVVADLDGIEVTLPDRQLF